MRRFALVMAIAGLVSCQVDEPRAPDASPEALADAASGPPDAAAPSDAATALTDGATDREGEGERKRYDVAIYGATAAGVATAIAASREGARVVLIEPGAHLGGMVTAGLGWTDFGTKAAIGGIARELFERLGKKYGTEIAWTFEPHVAEAVLREWVAETKIDVVFGARLREKTGVDIAEARVVAIHAESGTTYEADVFVDASYEGDLMAQAQVGYTYGREAIAAYGESLAGVRATTPKHQFTVDVSPFDGATLSALVQPGAKGDVGAGDRKVQAYNFRLCLTNRASNRLPHPRPSDYDPARYALLGRMIDALTAKNGAPPKMASLMKPSPVPNAKTDLNNQGAISTDYIGASWAYPEADYATRAKIWQDHISYIQGFFYYLANDPGVPLALREEVSAFGPSKDEFVDTDHFPHQLYVREARRMLGEYVMVQKDIQTDRAKPDAIGMGSYNSDSHNVQRIVTPSGFVENEGDMQVSVSPYQIPYRILLPKRAEATNLLVPVSFSASHVAYSTLRMEPQYMILGHAAGVAAKLAIDGKVAVQDVPIATLQATLTREKAVLALP